MIIEKKIYIFGIKHDHESVKTTVASNIDEAYDNIAVYGYEYFEGTIATDSFEFLIKSLDKHGEGKAKEVLQHYINDEMDQFKHKICKYVIEWDGHYDVKTVGIKPNRNYFTVVSDAYTTVEDVEVISLPKAIGNNVTEVKRIYANNKSHDPFFRHTFVDGLICNAGLLGRFFDSELYYSKDDNYVKAELHKRISSYFEKREDFADLYFDYWLEGQEKMGTFPDEFYEYVYIKELTEHNYEFLEINQIDIEGLSQ